MESCKDREATSQNNGRKIGSRTETALLFLFSQRNVESRTQASPLNYAREVKTSERERERERESRPIFRLRQLPYLFTLEV